MFENISELVQVNFPNVITQFLRIIDYHPTDKTVLDCGAGGGRPPLALFKIRGYETKGIDNSKERIEMANQFAAKYKLELDLIEADMRNIPFEDNSFGCVFSFNTIFHMNKMDIEKSVKEMLRVLKSGGLLYVNFIWHREDMSYLGEEREPGEFWSDIEGEDTLHTCHKDNEAESYFEDAKIVYKEKRELYYNLRDREFRDGYIDYVVEK